LRRGTVQRLDHQTGLSAVAVGEAEQAFAVAAPADRDNEKLFLVGFVAAAVGGEPAGALGERQTVVEVVASLRIVPGLTDAVDGLSDTSSARCKAPLASPAPSF